MSLLKKYGLPVLILLMSILYIFFFSDQIVFKLIPMWLIICYAYLQFPSKRSFTHWLVLIGLFFCMLGDGLLEKWFVIGLTAFLIGHLFYMAAFFSCWKFSRIRFGTIILLILYGLLIGKELMDGLVTQGNDALLVPVLFYIIIISLMAWAAIMTKNKWAITGSIFFVISDSILAWNMFISDITYSGSLIMTTYYGAQFLIAQSIGNLKTDL
ncbi:lysoplasmalogenase [Virgibacillus subterraneus]|uniref:lysoplasmalogenase n=1 Tax=Virgibacillus subterraneus TaxID=621109 RepID=UPI003183FCF6